MTSADLGQIASDLVHLGVRGSAVFGSSTHGFKLKPTLSEGVVAEFELRHGVRLPEDYRQFITRIGSGGAGPYYGLFQFGQMDDGHDFRDWQEGDGFVGFLGDKFPHSDSWNDLAGEPDESLADSDEDEYWRQVEVFEGRYFAALDGAIPICHLGCALRHWLVITGPEAGNVWADDRADRGGLSPIINSERGRTTFFEWYRAWLDEALASA